MGIIQERDLRRAVLGKLQQGSLVEFAGKWGKKIPAQCYVIARTRLQYAVNGYCRITECPNGGEQRRRRCSPYQQHLCQMSPRQTFFFFKTTKHVVSFLGHLNCSPVGQEVGGSVGGPQSMWGQTTSRMLLQEYLTASLVWGPRQWGGGGFEVFKPTPPPEIPKTLQNLVKLNPI